MTQTITPLFQTNLILHMCMPYPKNFGFNPYFYNLGYKIQHIERLIPLTNEGRNKLAELNINRKNVTPEIVMTNDKEIVLFECKSNDFDFDISHHSSQQAASYFTLSPEYLSQYLGLASQTFQGKILYVVPSNNNILKKVSETLEKIKDELKQIISETLPHDIFTILINEDGTFIGFKENKNMSYTKIIDSTIMQHHSMIYLIPVDPNGRKDKHSEEILVSQVRMKLRTFIGRRLSINGFKINSLEICKSINPFWDALPQPYKRKMIQWVDSSIRTFNIDLEKAGVKVVYENKEFKCEKLSQKQISKVESLLISDFNIENINSIQLSLEM